MIIIQVIIMIMYTNNNNKKEADKCVGRETCVGGTMAWSRFLGSVGGTRPLSVRSFEGQAADFLLSAVRKKVGRECIHSRQTRCWYSSARKYVGAAYNYY